MDHHHHYYPSLSHNYERNKGKKYETKIIKTKWRNTDDIYQLQLIMLQSRDGKNKKQEKINKYETRNNNKTKAKYRHHIPTLSDVNVLHPAPYACCNSISGSFPLGSPFAPVFQSYHGATPSLAVRLVIVLCLIRSTQVHFSLVILYRNVCNPSHSFPLSLSLSVSSCLHPALIYLHSSL